MIGDTSGARIGDTRNARVFEAMGITEEFLAEKLWEELHALTSKRKTLKGAIQDGLPEGYVIVAETEQETLIQWEEINWGVRQAARIDAQKLLDMYPSERRKLDINFLSHEEALKQLDEDE